MVCIVNNWAIPYVHCTHDMIYFWTCEPMSYKRISQRHLPNLLEDKTPRLQMIWSLWTDIYLTRTHVAGDSYTTNLIMTKKDIGSLIVCLIGVPLYAHGSIWFVVRWSHLDMHLNGNGCKAICTAVANFKRDLSDRYCWRHQTIT